MIKRIIESKRICLQRPYNAKVCSVSTLLCDRWVAIVAVYIPPYNTQSYTRELEGIVAHIEANHTKEIIILGNLNTNSLHWHQEEEIPGVLTPTSTVIGPELASVCKLLDKGFMQLNHLPNSHEIFLDLVFYNINCRTSILLAAPSQQLNNNTIHHSAIIMHACLGTHSEIEENTRVVRDYKKVYIDVLRDNVGIITDTTEPSIFGMGGDDVAVMDQWGEQVLLGIEDLLSVSIPTKMPKTNPELPPWVIVGRNTQALQKKKKNRNIKSCLNGTLR